MIDNYKNKSQRIMLNYFLKLIPRKYLQTIISNITKNYGLDLDKFDYQLMDYDKYDIYVLKGVRKNSVRKEPETVNWIENYIKPGQVIFDIGANIGAYSLIAAKFFRGTVKIYAFEPGFQNFPYLAWNIIKNNCTDIIIPLNLPLSSVQTLNTFNYISLDEGSSCHTFGDSIDYKGDPFHPVFEQLSLSSTVDDLVQNHNLLQPNHIKLDVDGLEFEIIKGARTSISNDHFESLLIEFCEERPEWNELVSFLEKCGLNLCEKHSHPSTNNYIFKK